MRASQDSRFPDAGFVASIAATWEATARKLGNVHPRAAFTDCKYLDFIVSAQAIASPLRDSATGFAGAILDSVKATRAVTDRNTNLGIILLLAPLAAVRHLVWLSSSSAAKRFYDLRAGLPECLSETTLDDTISVFEAIRIAKPNGLGRVDRQDVDAQPTVTLVEAMKLAADRDLIARQYSNNFADVFDLGVPALIDGFTSFENVEAAVIHCQLAWMAEFPDSLIARKCGVAVAEDVRESVRTVQKLGGLATAEGRAAGVALDKYLRSDGNKFNPGTTADLVCACLFVALREGKIPLNAPFEWKVEDWL